MAMGYIPLHVKPEMVHAFFKPPSASLQSSPAPLLLCCNFQIFKLIYESYFKKFPCQARRFNILCIYKNFHLKVSKNTTAKNVFM